MSESRTFRLKPFQDRYIFSDAKFPAMVSAWGTGKTMCGISRAMIHSDKYPDNLGVIFRREFTDLRDSTCKDFELYTRLKIDSSREVKLPNRSTIMFRHLEEIRNLQNINLGWFLIEQAEELLTDEQFFMLFGRLRRAGVPHWGSVIANTRGHNWIYKLWRQGALQESELIEATTYDNADNLSKDFLATLDQLKSQKPKLYANYVLNSWDEVTGQFFDGWSNAIHVVKPFPIAEEHKIYMSMDWGYAAPTAIYWWAVPPARDHVYCIREYYETRKTSPEVAADVNAINQSMFGEHYIRERKVACLYSDPSIFSKSGQTGKSIYEDFSAVFQEAGEDGRKAKLLIVPSKNDRIQGWALMRDMLSIQPDGKPFAMWFSTCSHAIETIPVLQHDEHNQEDLDTDGEDHAADSARYFFIERFGGKKIATPLPYAALQDDGSRREWENVHKNVFRRAPKRIGSVLGSVGR